MSATQPTTEAAEKEFLITRVFDAPRDLVWKAWTDCEHVTRWWGPKDFTSPACKIDLRVGGTYLFCMRSSDGKDYWSTGVYREIMPVERLTMTDSFSDEHGHVVSPAEYGMDSSWPDESVVTVIFEPYDGRTKLMVRTGVPRALAERFGAGEGWNQSLDKLAGYLATVPREERP